MMSLHEYENAALKIISNWHKKKGKLHISDELIGRMIRFMAVADWKYDETKSKLSRYQFRQMRGIYAIREYLSQQAKARKHERLNIYTLYDEPAEYDEKIGKQLNFLIKNAGLNDREKEVIDNALSGQDIGQTAECLGISYGRCNDIYNKSVNKMRRIAKGA